MIMKTTDADVAAPPHAVLEDTDIVQKIRAGETALFEVLMRRRPALRSCRGRRMGADADVLVAAAPTGDRHECPVCRGTWIRIVHDRLRTVLRCMRCGERFTVPPARECHG
jgi:hypothetical protein